MAINNRNHVAGNIFIPNLIWVIIAVIAIIIIIKISAFNHIDYYSNFCFC